MCGAQEENLMHFMLECGGECPGLRDIRRERRELQSLYAEDLDGVVGEYLFGPRHIEEKKTHLYKMWKQREKLYGKPAVETHMERNRNGPAVVK